MRYESLYDLNLTYSSREEHAYKDVNGEDARELLLQFEADRGSEEKIVLFREPFCMMFHNRVVKLRIPIIEAELKRFFENYKDYYYLPAEDMCILKAAASGVDKAYRENAKKETCYTKYRGFFIPQLTSDENCFRSDHKSRKCYRPYDPAQFTPEYCEKIGSAIISYLNR